MGELRRGRLEEGHLSRPLIYLSLQGLGGGGDGRRAGFTQTDAQRLISAAGICFSSFGPDFIQPPDHSR